MIRSSATWKYNNYNNNKEGFSFRRKELHGSTRTTIMASTKVHPCTLISGYTFTHFAAVITVGNNYD